MTNRSAGVARLHAALAVVVLLVLLTGLGRCVQGGPPWPGGAGSALPATSSAPPSAPLTDPSAAPGAAPPPGTDATRPEPIDPLSPEGPASGGAPVELPPPPPDPLVAGARDVLPTLEVKGRAPRTGYSREAFGQAWSDDVSVEFGHNGCDTRNDILRRDLQAVVLKPGTRGCVVLSGVLVGPYTGERVDFVRGSGTSQLVQIDHVVSLSDAWQKGAQQLSPERRTDLANDPLNLLAVTGGVNQAKGDGDAATWLPPAVGFRCGYVARQVLVKHAYGLWVTDAERTAMDRVLSTCGESG